MDWQNESITRNQVRIAVDKSPLPLWERARVRVRRAPARLRGRDARAPRQPNLPLQALYGRGLGRAALARLCKREFGRKPYPRKPIKGVGICRLLFTLGFDWILLSAPPWERQPLSFLTSLSSLFASLASRSSLFTDSRA